MLFRSVGFKAFMSGSGIDDFQAADDATLWEGMRVAGELGLPVLVHAENDGITAALAREAIAGGRTGVRDYLASRPVVAEVEAIRRAIIHPIVSHVQGERHAVAACEILEADLRDRFPGSRTRRSMFWDGDGGGEAEVF